MTGPERRHAILEAIAAELALLKADRAVGLKACGRSIPTVYRVLRGQDHRLSTLIDIADALNCDVEIRIVKRSA